MARIPRNQLPGGWYHCINRGADRKTIFFDYDDYHWFLKTLHKYASQNGIQLSAFCLMPNHWHIVLNCAQSANMTSLFKKLLHDHTRRHHSKYLTIGHGPIYQGRFKSFLIQDEEALNTVNNYVVLNPVRASLAKSVDEWPWSSQAWGQSRD